MSVLQHMDYQGEVAFETDRLIIRILHIDDFITTEVDNASQAQAAFEELVDDYIASCAELGKQPCKPFKGSFNVRMTPALHKQAAFAAAAEGETLNSFVVGAIEQRLLADEVDDVISTSVARAMAAYAMRQSQRGPVVSSQWKVMEIEASPTLDVAWEGVFSVPTANVWELPFARWSPRR